MHSGVFINLQDFIYDLILSAVWRQADVSDVQTSLLGQILVHILHQIVITGLNNCKHWLKGRVLFLQQAQHFLGIVNDVSDDGVHPGGFRIAWAMAAEGLAILQPPPA